MPNEDQPYTGPDRRAGDRRVADRRRAASPAGPRQPSGRPTRLRRVPDRGPLGRGFPVALALAILALGSIAFMRWSHPARESGASAAAVAGSRLARPRAEALCLLLARPPGFTPPMAVEPDVRVEHEGFGPAATPALAAAQVLGLDGPQEMRRWVEHVGDFDVAAMWIRLPGDERHVLLITWREGAELALCRFHFACQGAQLSPEEVQWGDELLDRLLVPRNFRARSLPPGRGHSLPAARLPSFGPGSQPRG